MDRRAFLAALAALIAPCGANAQPLGKLARIGYLQGVAPVREQDDAGRPLYVSLGFVPTNEMRWSPARMWRE